MGASQQEIVLQNVGQDSTDPDRAPPSAPKRHSSCHRVRGLSQFGGKTTSVWCGARGAD
jgi:hypothetical protein